MGLGFFKKIIARGMILCAAAAWMLGACQAGTPLPGGDESPSPRPTASLALLTPYSTRTATYTPLPPDPATFTPFPTPTPTPRTHTVKRGEDMFGIAWQYGITLPELQTANPDVNPSFLSVDTVLIIPASTLTTPTLEGLPSPTPAGASAKDTRCYRTLEGGLWCFTNVTNDSQKYIEGVSLEVRLGSAGSQIASVQALTAINLLAPGMTVPAAAYFAPSIPQNYEVDAALNTSLPVVNLSERYFSTSLADLSTVIEADGMSASVEGVIVLNESGKPSYVSAAAIAYNAGGQVIGYRRWESTDGKSTNRFSMQVYSLAGEIDHISVFVEAAR